MSAAPLRMRSGLLTKSLRQRSRSGDVSLDAQLLASKEAKSGSEPTSICKQLKRYGMLAFTTLHFRKQLRSLLPHSTGHVQQSDQTPGVLGSGCQSAGSTLS